MASRNSLLADLRIHLLGRLTPDQLRGYGWADFVVEDGKLADEPLGIAFEVTIYVFCDSRRWTGCLGGLSGILAFLTAKTGKSPTQAQVVALAGILEQYPVNDDTLWEWFCDVFDP